MTGLTIFRPLLFCFAALMFTAYGAFIAHAKPDLTGKWAGTFSCGDASAGKVTIDIATEQETTEGLLIFDSPQMEGSLKVKVRSDEGGRIAFLPVAWVDQPKQAAMPTLVGTLDADAITGTLSGCKGNAAISLMREAEPEQVAIQAGDLLEPTPISGGIAQGHWQGTLTCKRNKRWPIESFPVEADIVQDGQGVAALFGIRIPMTPGDTSGPTHNQTVLIHGHLSENGLKLFDPTYLAKGNGWRFKGLSVTLSDGGQSAHGTPDMNKCDSIALTKVGPSITPQIPKEWAGLWQGTVGRTRSTVAFVPQANPAIVELRSEFPTTAPLADQGHLIAVMVPFYAKNGKVLLVLAGTRAGTGEFRNADTSNAGKHNYIHTRAFLIGAQGPDALILSRVLWDDGLQNFFADPKPMRLDTEHADLLLKRIDATSAQLMASGKKPPLSLAGSLGGTLAQASTLEDQCGVLAAWIKPSAERGGGKLTYEAMLDAFRDGPFVSVFGLPFPLLSSDERRAVAVLTRHCRQELGTAALSDELTTTFEIALLHKNAVKAMDARIATTGWRDDKRKEIAALPDGPGSLAKLQQIEAESRKALENFTQAERDQFKAELAARSAEIEGALLRRSVADVLNAPGGTNTLDELGALRRKIADSGIPAEIKQELSETVVVKAKTIAVTLYNEAVATATAAPRSLEGLATTHSIRLSMARLANRMQTDFGVDRGDSLKSTLALEWAMLSDPVIQSAFRDKMMAVEPGGDPVDSVREVASTYLDLDRLGDNSPPFGAYIRAVEEASARAEIASIDFQDVSGMTSPDEPTAEEMLKLVLKRVHRVNDGMHDRMERCRARDYQNDPALAVMCIQLFSIRSDHDSEFRVRLKSFSKLGCVPVTGNNQFDCQFETALSSNIDQSMGELGRIFSTPGVQTARMVHNADGGWSMIY